MTSASRKRSHSAAPASTPRLRAYPGVRRSAVWSTPSRREARPGVLSTIRTESPGRSSSLARRVWSSSSSATSPRNGTTTSTVGLAMRRLLVDRPGVAGYVVPAASGRRRGLSREALPGCEQAGVVARLEQLATAGAVQDLRQGLGREHRHGRPAGERLDRRQAEPLLVRGEDE